MGDADQGSADPDTWFASVSTAGLAANDEFRVTVGGIPVDERKERFSALRGVCKNIILFY